MLVSARASFHPRRTAPNWVQSCLFLGGRTSRSFYHLPVISYTAVGLHNLFISVTSLTSTSFDSIPGHVGTFNDLFVV